MRERKDGLAMLVEPQVSQMNLAYDGILKCHPQSARHDLEMASIDEPQRISGYFIRAIH